MPRVRLEETRDWQLAERSHDVRGRELRDSVGRTLGTIKTMIVDTDARRVESVVLEDETEYPVRDLQIMEQAVYFIPVAVPDAPAAEAAAAPAHDAPAAEASATESVAEAPAYDTPAADLTEQPTLDLPDAAVTTDLPPAPEASAYQARTEDEPAVPEADAPAYAEPSWSAPASAPDETAAPEPLAWQPPPVPPSAPDAAPPPPVHGWNAPAVDEPPAPPPMEAAPAEPDDAPSPYAAPPAYSAPAYTPPPPPPPYVAPEVQPDSSEPMPADARPAPFAATASDSDPFGDEPEADAAQPESSLYADAGTPAPDPLADPFAAPAPDPLADPFAAPAMLYAEPTDPEPPSPDDYGTVPAEVAAGVMAPGMEVTGFGPPALPAEDAPAPAAEELAEPAEVDIAPEATDERPVAPLIEGGAAVVAPPEPGHAPAPYAGVAAEPAFPTHAAPAEAAAGHTLAEPAAAPEDAGEAGGGFRAHFGEHYSDSGATFDDLAAAYEFGAEARGVPELRWADDGLLRRRFNERFGYPADDRVAWLGARRAVRHGLERGRG